MPRGQLAVAPSVQTLDLTEWVHLATERDHYVKIVYDGTLYPFGHRASLVKVTDEFLGSDTAPANSPVAYLRQHMYIVVREPQKTYQGAPYVNQGREMPLAAQITIKTVVTPDIDPIASGAVPGSSASFWVRVDNADLKFHLAAVNSPPPRSTSSPGLIFVPLPNKPERGAATVCRLGRASDVRHACAQHRLRRSDGGRHVVKDYGAEFRTQAVTRSRPISPSSTPPMRNFRGHPRARGAHRQASPDVSIHLYGGYLSGGLDVNAGVFAQANVPPPVTFTADKSGGFATPNMSVTALSARKGLVAGDPGDAAAGKINPSAFFGDISAKLFGVIPLQNLIPVVGGLADAGKNAPEIRTKYKPNQAHAQQAITTVNWSPSLAELPAESDQFIAAANPVRQQRGAQAAVYNNTQPERLAALKSDPRVDDELLDHAVRRDRPADSVHHLRFDHGSKTNVVAKLPSSTRSPSSVARLRAATR